MCSGAEGSDGGKEDSRCSCASSVSSLQPSASARELARSAELSPALRAARELSCTSPPR